MRLLVTGGCGFLGSHFVRAWLRRHPDSRVVNADCLTYAGSLDNLEDLAADPRHVHRRVDIADARSVAALFADPFDLIIHFAAESHVDRSLEDAGRFVRTNVLGTQTLLAAAEQTRSGADSPPVVVMSTDEVYGPAPAGVSFDIEQAAAPTSPYAASKTAADWMALAYAKSFGLDVTIVRSVNVYGPRQHPEKMIPLFALRALAGEKLPLYGDGLQSRSWLFIDDFVSGLLRIAEAGDVRSQAGIWHLGSAEELRNRDLAHRLCVCCGADPSLITPAPDRPGHDQRYALDDSATREAFGWQPEIGIERGLAKTIDWIKEHQDWCRHRSTWMPAFLQGH